NQRRFVSCSFGSGCVLAWAPPQRIAVAASEWGTAPRAVPTAAVATGCRAPEARARVASVSAMVEAARRPPAALAATAAHKGRAASVPAASVSAKAGALGAPATLAAPAARVAWARRAQVARAPPARP